MKYETLVERFEPFQKLYNIHGPLKASMDITEKIRNSVNPVKSANKLIHTFGGKLIENSREAALVSGIYLKKVQEAIVAEKDLDYEEVNEAIDKSKKNLTTFYNYDPFVKKEDDNLVETKRSGKISFVRSIYMEMKDEPNSAIVEKVCKELNIDKARAHSYLYQVRKTLGTQSSKKEKSNSNMEIAKKLIRENPHKNLKELIEPLAKEAGISINYAPTVLSKAKKTVDI